MALAARMLDFWASMPLMRDLACDECSESHDVGVYELELRSLRKTLGRLDKATSVDEL